MEVSEQLTGFELAENILRAVMGEKIGTIVQG